MNLSCAGRPIFEHATESGQLFPVSSLYAKLAPSLHSYLMHTVYFNLCLIFEVLDILCMLIMIKLYSENWQLV